MMRPAFVLIFVVSSFAQTNNTVFPTEFATQEGNAALGIFLVSEFQQVMRSSTFGPFNQSPVNLTGVSLRVNGASGSMDAVVPRFEIRLSTSSRTPETMSKFYNANVGTDEVFAYGHDNVHLFSTDAPAPRPFDLQFQFDQPFFYDPKEGNLLIDFRHTGSAGPLVSSVDSHSYATFSESPFGSYFTGDVAPNAYGAVLQFDWVAVPEPRFGELITLGSIVLFVAKRKLLRT